MGTSRIPGPLGWNDTLLDLDDGTLMRWAMPVPGPVGTAATPTVVATSTAAKAQPRADLVADQGRHAKP